MKLVQLWLRHLCAIYTISAMLLLLTNLLLKGTTDNVAVNMKLFLLLFLFAAVFGLANVVYLKAPMSHGARLLVHFLIVTLGAFLLLYLPSGATVGGDAMKFVMLFVILALYWPPMGIYLWIRAAWRRAHAPQKPAEYKSVYKK